MKAGLCNWIKVVIIYKITHPDGKNFRNWYWREPVFMNESYRSESNQYHNDSFSMYSYLRLWQTAQRLNILTWIFEKFHICMWTDLNL